MTNTLKSRLRTRRADLESRGLLRHPTPPSGIDLCSNDYLGLAAHPSLVRRLRNAVAHDGCGSTGSRLLRGHRDSFSDIERRFAEFKGTERSLYFSSGYLANLAVLSTLPETNDVIFSDARNHASLIDGIRLSPARCVVFPHNDLNALSRLLAEDIGTGQRFVVIESLFGMDGDFAPLTEYASICQKAKALLIVDEAHAVGVYGDDGSGLIRATGISDEAILSVNTAGKALGVAGAFVAGPTWAIDHLEQSARPFIFSTAGPPALAAVLDTSLDIITTEPERRKRLHARVRFLRNQLNEIGISLPQDSSQIIPVIVGQNEKAVLLAGALQKQGFDVRAIRPPSVPEGTARLRISVNTELSENELGLFAHSLQQYLEEVELCSAVSL